MFNNIIMNTFFMHKTIEFNGIKLDKYQSKAVMCDAKSYLVIAGAGSGKTLTIAAKIDYLIKNNVSPNKILCISFTNESVNSLKKVLEKNNIIVDVKTFHRLSLDIIGKEYNISSSDYLLYITEEYFNSYIYLDNTYLLIEEYLSNSKKLKFLINTIVTFIHYMKSLIIDINHILTLTKNKDIDIDNRIILLIIIKIYILYYEELKSVNRIDFDDMINKAKDKVLSLKYFKYSHIIIDEYQDTSYGKYKLIKNIKDKFNTNLMAVGDDYQSIYSFTGCDLSLFTKFKKLFKGSKIIKLKYTYRNSSDIVEISKRFVIKNRNQINKRLISKKYINKSINIVYIENYIDSFISIVKELKNVLVLGRNNNDIYKIIDNDRLTILNDKIIFKDDESLNIKFLTVHSSKGLEEDDVIILNNIDDVLGFPNKIIENEVLDYIFINKSKEEERRLFYVALTRSRNKVFLFTIRNKESIFIKELLRDFKYKINIIDLSKKL